jgi:hypothetical protein
VFGRPSIFRPSNVRVSAGINVHATACVGVRLSRVLSGGRITDK